MKKTKVRCLDVFKEIVKARSSSWPGEFNFLTINETLICKDYPDLKDRIVHVCEDVDELRKRGLLFIAAINAEGKENEYIILVDQYLYLLPKQAQLFFLLHELGHIVNGDLDISKKGELKKHNLKRILFKKSDIEFKADEYAMSKTNLTTSISALNSIMEITGYGVLSRKEIRIRIKNLIEKRRLQV